MSGSWRERDDPENRACEISLARFASVHGCFGGGNSCDMRHLFVVDSLDKHIPNEKEFILASAGVGGGFVFVWG